MPIDDQNDRRPGEMLPVNPLYARSVVNQVPKHRLPDGPMDPDTAFQIVHDELLLDGNARTNLATFVTTWMEPQGARLMTESADKNMIDKDEYPQTAELERRCVSTLAGLWHSPGEPVGVSTTGSSEACMLGGLALKRRWQQRTGSTARPNLVMGANVQVVWEKFCNYFEVEARQVPVEAGRHHLDGPHAAGACDKNTIGVVAILGSTFDGSYEPVAEMAAALDQLKGRDGHDVPIHVDAASGGLVAPFIDPGLEWDFQLERVASINASGHKYGLVYPGIGWVLWRDHDALPDDLVFDVDYLGGNMPTFTLNFSRPGSQVAAQYYTFLRLGFDGYRAVQQTSRDVARHLSDAIAAMDDFELLSDGSELPAFAFRLADGVHAYSVYDVQNRLREYKWIVPAYKFPKDLDDMHVLRVVVRNGFSRDLADHFQGDLDSTVRELQRQAGPVHGEEAAGFHH